MDLIYDRVDELMREGRFQILDEILSHIRVNKMTVDVLLGLLTATLPAKKKLPSRPSFFREAERSIKDRGELEEGLLTGLD